ncbi:unnamed protein product, partial [Ectocarpus sp. 8 AP-2014]
AGGAGGAGGAVEEEEVSVGGWGWGWGWIWRGGRVWGAPRGRVWGAPRGRGRGAPRGRVRGAPRRGIWGAPRGYVRRARGTHPSRRRHVFRGAGAPSPRGLLRPRASRARRWLRRVPGSRAGRPRWGWPGVRALAGSAGGGRGGGVGGLAVHELRRGEERHGGVAGRAAGDVGAGQHGDGPCLSGAEPQEGPDDRETRPLRAREAVVQRPQGENFWGSHRRVSELDPHRRRSEPDLAKHGQERLHLLRPGDGNPRNAGRGAGRGERQPGRRQHHRHDGKHRSQD